MFFSGLNLFFLGIIGEYVGRVYEEAKARPHYVIRKVIGLRAPCVEAPGTSRARS